MTSNPTIEPVHYLSNTKVTVDTLRLDSIHPIVSGNKWYKLRYYIQNAIDKQANTIASFGGPFSNHLVALAYSANIAGLKSIGYVRSNKGEPITPSLEEAMHYGMQLIHLGREHFQEKKNDLLKQNKEPVDNTYFVNEGGYGILGARGASTIISDWNAIKDKINETVAGKVGFGINNQNKIHDYQYILCAVGTGTMAAGILNALSKQQKMICIPVLKNEGTIKTEITHLLEDKNIDFELLNTFHEGGYAKTSPSQIEFMNRLWLHAKIPTDIVYTGKLFYAVEQLVQKKYFKPNSKVLVIHSGGLQGNRSLASGILNF